MAQQFEASPSRIEGNTHVLIVTTGSVASIKLPLIVEELAKSPRISIQVIATEASLTFYDAEEVARVSEGKTKVWRDKDEWKSWKKVGDPILHIELRRWADVVLVAPCSANTLAKIAGGVCDNVATSVLRALSPSTPTYLFPAMNTFMWEHPLTRKQINIVEQEIGYKVVGPVGKALACGDVGMGAMTEWKDIVQLFLTNHAPFNSLPTTSVTTSTPSASTSTLRAPLPPPSPSIISRIIPFDRPQAPPPSLPSPEELLTQSRHPLHLPLNLIEKLQAERVLPSTLVHNPGKPDASGNERRKFFFVPDRLDEAQLKRLGETLATKEGWGGEEESEEGGFVEKELKWQEGEGARWLREKFTVQFGSLSM